MPVQRADIQIRDPFIVTIPEERRYLLFGTTDKNCWEGGTGFDAYSSADLEDWEGPFPIFRPPPGFWGTKNFWAPEVHRHRGRWLLLASFKAEGRCRGTQALAADAPLGPYAPVGGGPLTPPEWECLDGTLFVDDADAPWLVFCHEWVQVTDGEICAMRLRADLTGAEGDPMRLFRASEAPWVRPIRNTRWGIERGYVTDGPFLHRTAGGALLMLWSSVGVEGYAIGVARSATGRVTGPWAQEDTPLYGRDGGHGMLFRALDGRLMLTIHAPNRTPQERPIFIEVAERDGTLRLAGGCSPS